MKKQLKHLIARKTYIAIGVLLVVNICITLVTLNQRSDWIGHIETSQKNQTVAFEQYKDQLTFDIVAYAPEQQNVVYKTMQYTYTFKPQNAHSYAVENRKMNIPTSVHRFFALDDQCTLLFRTPVRQILANASLVCRN